MTYLQVVSLLLAFLISLTLMWEPQNEIYFLRASYAIWYALSAHISCYFNFIRLPSFLIFQLMFLIGFFVPTKVDPALMLTGRSYFYYNFKFWKFYFTKIGFLMNYYQVKIKLRVLFDNPDESFSNWWIIFKYCYKKKRVHILYVS